MDYSRYPSQVVQDIIRLRRRIQAAGLPPRRTDANVIVGTWNLQKFGGFHPAWTENPGSPKRNLRCLALIAEVIRGFDVIALQEVQRDTSALRYLMEHFLGSHWAVLLTDVTAGDKGNSERLAYLYDTRRVVLSGLSGEIVLPLAPAGVPEQFDRTPYIAGFRAGQEHFTLLTVHIRYGALPANRLPELQQFAHYAARELRERTRTGQSREEPNLLVLGDFNIDRRQGNPLFDAFVETGLWVPEALQAVRTTTGKRAKHYDQIAWFQGEDFGLRPSGLAGTIDFAGAVFQELAQTQVSPRISDHLPLWIEFSTDRSEEAMAGILGWIWTILSRSPGCRTEAGTGGAPSAFRFFRRS
ncbi:endonuclease/exonuclease/phosphatase family protein [Pseudoxanthomonas suwonensis]|uniref:endonuclease/exonuclease/phosphatase family protein n=1 Tax=Pseudoxanthomonas suwonensis TaxID=314722 RepID=UPI000AE98132|nr:endonuclease/exonuclease/phosphatase family protein [Pseudoxanthomonas suwonensis]